MTAHPLSSPASCIANTSFPLHASIPTDAAAFSIADGLGLAHDAGNLLSALGLYAGLLDRPGVLRPQHRHYAEELQRLSERSGNLIRRLLAAPPSNDTPSGRERGPQQPNACDGVATLRELAPLLRSVAGPRARVVLHLAADVPALPCLNEDLERIVLNLVRNAAEASASRPRADGPMVVTVRLKSALQGSPGGVLLEWKTTARGCRPQWLQRSCAPRHCLQARSVAWVIASCRS